MTDFTTPVGRLVGGSVSTPHTQDSNGQPLVYKSGAKMGQPRVEFSFGLAIAKGVEQHWNQTAWGKPLWHAGVAGFPQGQYNSPAFSWKVTDGDSAIPNTKGTAPNTREGYPRHWILWFSSATAPRLYADAGTRALHEPDAIKLGYFVQVQGNVKSNDEVMKPGIYLNHNMVCLAGYGEVIQTGPDPRAAGFGQSPLPAGASAVPLAGMAPTGAVPLAGMAPTGAAPLPPMAAQMVANHMPVAPNPAILQVPAVPPAAPVAPPAPQMNPQALAAGHTYAAFKAAGWSDDQMRQAGYLL